MQSLDGTTRLLGHGWLCSTLQLMLLSGECRFDLLLLPDFRLMIFLGCLELTFPSSCNALLLLLFFRIAQLS